MRIEVGKELENRETGQRTLRANYELDPDIASNPYWRVVPDTSVWVSPARTIFLDMDGVMADFDGHFFPTFGEDHTRIPEKRMWDLITEHGSYFRSLPMMEDAKLLWDFLAPFHPVLLTACPRSDYASVAKQKRDWARHHLSPNVTVLPVMGGVNKPLFMHREGDILIDDFGRNCEAWRAFNGHAIKHRSAIRTIEELELLGYTGPGFRN